MDENTDLEGVSNVVLDKSNLYKEHNGKFVREIIDDAPPVKNLKFLTESGELVDGKPEQIAERKEYFWRHHQSTLALLLALSSFALIGVLLSGMDKFTSVAWDTFAGFSGWVINSFLGLFLSSKK